MIWRRMKILKNGCHNQTLCKICQISHEAEEFISSLLDIAAAEFMDSEEYKKLMIKHHFRERRGEMFTVNVFFSLTFLVFAFFFAIF